MMKRTILALIIVATGFAIGCSKDPSQPADPQNSPLPGSCDGISAKFGTDILPLVQTKCAVGGCHGFGSTNGPGPLTNFNEIKNSANIIKNAVVSKRMPLTGSLTNAEIAEISCWVDNGAQNN